MLKALHTSDSPLNLLDLDAIAKSSSFIQRKTLGFSASSIIIALIKCLQKGDASFNHLAIEMKDLNAGTLCSRAIHDRVNAKLIDYLTTVLSHLIPLQLFPAKPIKNRSGFKRIIIEDSTFVPMGSINAGNFPAFGNNRGVTAGFKLDLTYDILTQSILRQEFSAATQSDKKLGLAVLTELQTGDLLLRDMGYFSRDQFQQVEAQNAHWLSRLPASVDVTLADGTKLEKRLNLQATQIIETTPRHHPTQMLPIPYETQSHPIPVGF